MGTVRRVVGLGPTTSALYLGAARRAAERTGRQQQGRGNRRSFLLRRCCGFRFLLGGFRPLAYWLRLRAPRLRRGFLFFPRLPLLRRADSCFSSALATRTMHTSSNRPGHAPQQKEAVLKTRAAPTTRPSPLHGARPSRRRRFLYFEESPIRKEQRPFSPII